MKTKKCSECRGSMRENTSEMDGITYRYWKCEKCGDEVLDMNQLHETAGKYRELRMSHTATISKWGNALALRIPKEIVVSQNIKPGETVRIQKEKTGFKVIPEK